MQLLRCHSAGAGGRSLQRAAVGASVKVHISPLLCDIHCSPVPKPCRRHVGPEDRGGGPASLPLWQREQQWTAGARQRRLALAPSPLMPLLLVPLRPALPHLCSTTIDVQVNDPAVVVLQEWWGITDIIKAHAQKIADAGYRCIVPGAACCLRLPEAHVLKHVQAC